MSSVGLKILKTVQSFGLTWDTDAVLVFLIHPCYLPVATLYSLFPLHFNMWHFNMWQYESVFHWPNFQITFTWLQLHQQTWFSVLECMFRPHFTLAQNLQPFWSNFWCLPLDWEGQRGWEPEQIQWADGFLSQQEFTWSPRVFQSIVIGL